MHYHSLLHDYYNHQFLFLRDLCFHRFLLLLLLLVVSFDRYFRGIGVTPRYTKYRITKAYYCVFLRFIQLLLLLLSFLIIVDFGRMVVIFVVAVPMVEFLLLLLILLLLITTTYVVVLVFGIKVFQSRLWQERPVASASGMR